MNLIEMFNIPEFVEKLRWINDFKTDPGEKPFVDKSPARCAIWGLYAFTFPQTLILYTRFIFWLFL